MPTFTGSNGANGTGGTSPTAGGKGQDQIFTYNGNIGADSMSIFVTGGNGGVGGTNSGPGAGASGGNGGNASITLNGNIFQPMGSNLLVEGTATGGNGGAGGGGGTPGTRGNGGNASVIFSGNIVQTTRLLSFIAFDAFAVAGDGARSGNAIATISGNIIQYNGVTATDVFLRAIATQAAPDLPSNTGQPGFGTKAATINGNIIQGNVNSLLLQADARYSNGTATISGNIFNSRSTNTGFVTMAVTGQSVAITGNILNLGQQEVDISLTELGPTYKASISGNIFNGTGNNTLAITDAFIPGPPGFFNNAYFNLATGLFIFDGQVNILNRFANVVLSPDIQLGTVGTNGNDNLTGTPGNDVIYGLDGNDTINGLGGNDSLYGMNGNDILIGGPGNDFLDGGADSDTAVFSGPHSQYNYAGITVAGGTVMDTVPGRDGTDTLANIEFLQFSDGTLNVATGVFTPSGNTPPVANNDAFTTNEDAPLTVPAPGVLGNDTDADMNPLTAAIVSGPAHGTLTLNANGSFTYTPNANFNGSDSFTYQANDGTANSNTATVNITVNPVNDAPVANNDTFTTNEDTPLTVAMPGVLGNDTDVDGDPLTAALVTGPAHGSLTLNANGSFTYTPSANFNGSDSFTYRANDGMANSNTATVNITVNPVNDAPVANNDTFITNEDTPLTVAMPGVLGNDTDVDGDPLTAALVTGPAHGSLTLNADGSFTYTPSANFNGSDSFTYRANDGTVDSNTATVNITVNPVNDAPVANNDAYMTALNTPLVILAPGILGNDTDVDGDTLHVSAIVTGPTHGTLTAAADGSFTYTPGPGFAGNDSFTYTANDGLANSNTATVNITVGTGNTPPVANNDAFSVNEDTALTVVMPGVLANDTDANADPLTAALVTGPAHGSLTLNADGSFNYTPNANFNGADSFTYQANDGTANSNTATVNITVNPVNDAPVANNDAFATNEDTALTVAAPGVLGNDTDVDGDPLTAALVAGPAHGSLTLNANGSFTYTPNANFNGSDSFTYQANDGLANSNTATVNITVNPVNDAPVANNDAFATNEDTALTVAAPGVLGNDTDVDGDPLTAALVTGPAHGSLTLNPNGSFTYTPNANFNGADSFTYRANDGTANSNNATVNITVNPVNDAPVAVNDSFTTNEDTPLTVAMPGVLANDTDVEGDPLTAALVTGPAHGSLTLNANGSFSYTPNANFNGSDSFTYQANDGMANSNTATVTITVNPVNDAPVANNDAFTVNEDGTLTVTPIGVLANDTDVDGDPLTAALVTGPANGALTLNPNGSFTYTPNANFNGSDSFTYRANDGTANSNNATVTITVNPVNDAPVANDDSFTTNEDTPLTIAAPGVLGNDTDVDGDPLSVSTITTGPAHGSLSANADGSFTYTPNADFNGTDSFSYRANDGTVNSNIATVTITVNPVNDAPVANNDAFTTNEDTSLTVAAPGILGNDTDVDGDPLVVNAIITGPANGSLAINPNGSFTYTPNANFNGSDSFTYRASDGTANSNNATVIINVNPVNDAPVANNDAFATNEDTALTIAAPGVLGNDTDVDGDPLHVSAIVTGPAHGSLAINPDGSFTYTPNANFNGADSFTYQANDGTALSNPATVNITVNPVNDAPVAVNDSFTTNEDTPLTIAAPGVLGNDTDVDGDPLHVSAIVTGPAHGSLAINPDGSFTYTPNANFNGADSFSYQANDGTASSNTATVNITVNPVNDPPVAVNDSFSTNEDTALTIAAPGILGNDSDVDGDPLTVGLVVSGPAHGNLSVNADGSLTYTPNANFNGADSFVYRASDGIALSNPATVNITVNPVNDAPVANNDIFGINEDTVLTEAAPGVLGNDTDVDGDPLTAALVTGPAHGALTFNANGSFTYTPNANFNGSDSFTYQANDGTTTGNAATVTILIAPQNDAPVSTNDTYSVNEDNVLTVTAPGILGNDSDVDGDTLTVGSVLNGPAHGNLSMNANGSFTYTPDANFNGTDSFTYAAFDGTVTGNAATVTITVNPVNDAPVAVNDSFSTNQNAALTIAAPGVLANDTDADGDMLTVGTLVTGPAHGSLTLNTNGSFTYTPNAGFNGADSFTYRANDGTALSNTGTVNITVNPIANTPPVANNDAFATNEDTVLTVAAPGVLGNDTDANNDPLTAALVTGPAHGSLTLNANGSFTYTPNANFNGSDSFVYRANDGMANSGNATVNITVNPVNDAPVANNDSFSTNRNTALVIAPPGVLGNDTDVDGDPLSVGVIAAGPSHGSLTMNGDGSFTYNPTAGYTGADSFSYRAYDGTALSNTAAVNITVNAVANTAPVANNDAFTTTSNTALVIAPPGVLGNDTDADGDTLSVGAIVTGPAHGSLALNGNGSFTYTPNNGYSGADSFSYRAYDGTALSNTATVNITVNPTPNTPPVAVNDSFSTNQNTPLTIAPPGILGNDSDADGDPLSVGVIAAAPTHGSLTMNGNGSFTYTPNAGFSGADSFTYRAYDGTALSNTATVSITVNPVANTPPVANNDAFATNEDTTLTVAAPGVLGNDTDANNDPLTAALVTGPAHGSLTLNANGSFSYTPNANFNGSDSFVYRANDGMANSGNATVNITINPVNDAPVAVNDSFTTTGNTPLTIAAPGILGNDTDVENDTLSVGVIVAGPAHGSLAMNADGSFTYTPTANYNGTDSFTYRAYDGQALSNTATVNITVTNSPPVANADAYSVNEDNTLTIAAPGVLSNDTDADNNPLTAALVTGPANGTLTLNANGSFSYTPNANFNGSDSFTYKANDGQANSNTATVNITVNPVNDPPTATNLSAAQSYTEDTPLTLTAISVSDVDNTTTTANLSLSNIGAGALSAPTVAGATTTYDAGMGVLTVSGSISAVNSVLSNVTFTPTANFNGNFTIYTSVSDGMAMPVSGAKTITGIPVNDAPVANADAYSVNEDGTLTVAAPGVLGNDSDVDSMTLTAAVATGPANGTLALNANGSFTYTPNADFNGTDTFTYHANDGSLNSNNATVTITVNPVNDAPVAVNDSFSVNEDGTLTVPASGVLSNDTDVDGDPLTAALVTGPVNGSLTFNNDGSFTYTPNANFNGSDSFTYHANDGTVNSNTATVNITVNPVNDAPVANNDAFTTAEDTPLTIAAPGILGNDTDVDGDPLTAALVTGPAHGSLTLNADGSLTYTPNANFNGSDSFTYQANDGTALSNTATVNITVTPVNDAPVANNDSFTVNEDTLLTVPAPGVLTNDTDVDGDPLTAALVTGPAHGSLTFNADGSFNYQANANFNGTDSFTYQANDGTTNSGTATVNITINPVNDAPVAVNDSFTTAEDSVLTIAAPGVLTNDTDVDGDPLTAAVVGGPAHGSLTLNTDGSFTYTPNSNFNGTDSFTYQANDGTANSGLATVTINVTPVNDAPVAVNDSLTTAEDTPLTVAAPGILGNDTDVDGDTLTAALVTGPANGTLTLNADGSLTYTPNANFNGSDSFTYQANDGTANSNTATVNITVTPVNDPPAANADAFATNEDTALFVGAPGVLGNDSDVDGDPLTANLVTGPANGTLMLNADGSFTYTPNANFFGTDSFDYQANDGHASAAQATVTITVNPVNDAPVANNDSFTVNEDTLLSVPAPGILTNDTDVDGDPLTAVLVTGPAHGSLTLNSDGSFNYQANANFNGSDSFTYQANDGTTNSGTATVNITINPVNDAPVAVNDSYNVDINTPLTITAPGVLGNDTDVDNDPLTAAVVAGPTNGTLTLNADGSFTYTPNNAFTGTDTFTYQANDGTANSGTATVTLTVTDIGQTINGTAGNDTLTGTAGNDTVNGGAGDDILIATKGSDTLDGGTNAEGGDTADFRNATSGVTVDLTVGTPQDLTTNGLGPVTLPNIENLNGSAFADTLTGDAANNIFVGGLGNDTIDGGAGTNTAYFHGLETQYGVTGLTAVTGGPDGDDALSNIQRLKFLSPTHVGDLNNNGAGDLVFADDATGLILTSVDGAAANPVAFLGANMKAVAAGQFTADTDRMAGLLVQDTTSGSLSVLTDLTGAAPLTPLTNGPALTTNQQAIATGDFNGDGASDVLLQDSVTGDAQILFLNVNAGEAIGQVDSFATVAAPGPGYTAISSGDFNGDGKSDILWQNGGAVVVSLMSGSTVTNSAVLTPGVNYQAIGTGDFNGDGMSDIMFQNTTDGSALIWTMNGTAPTPTTFNVAAPTANSVLAGAQDVDGNGYSDLLWYDTTTGAVTATTFDAGGVLNAAVAQQSVPGFRLVASTGGG